MTAYNASLGEMVDQRFKADGNALHFQAENDIEAKEKVVEWMRSMPYLIIKSTHLRLQVKLTMFKRRVVGVWPIDDNWIKKLNAHHT